MFRVGRVFLKKKIYNASGVLSATKNELVSLNDNEWCGAVVSKSCTLEPREGNPHPRYYSFNGNSINSSGLPNLGYEYYRDLRHYIHKPYFMSVAGLTIQDNLTIFKDLNSYPEINIEFNVSCPNIPGKSQLGYDFKELNKTLNMIEEVYKLGYGLKLPPYFDPHHWDMVSNILLKHNIEFIVCINSLGNGLVYDKNLRTAIKPKNGLGGIGGPSIKPFGLSNVREFYRRLGNKISIVGCGGITSSEDVREYIHSGASACQVGTYLYEHGLQVFKALNFSRLN